MVDLPGKRSKRVQGVDPGAMLRVQRLVRHIQESVRLACEKYTASGKGEAKIGEDMILIAPKKPVDFVHLTFDMEADFDKGLLEPLGLKEHNETPDNED